MSATASLVDEETYFIYVIEPALVFDVPDYGNNYI